MVQIFVRNYASSEEILWKVLIVTNHVVVDLVLNIPICKKSLESCSIAALRPSKNLWVLILYNAWMDRASMMLFNLSFISFNWDILA